jgi:hypothetical protein
VHRQEIIAYPALDRMVGTGQFLSGHNAMITPHRYQLAALLGCLLSVVGLMRGTESSFIATLSPQQQTAAGLAGLEPAECAALDRMVVEELSQTRRPGSLDGLSPFSVRRSAAERQTAGLFRLTAEQLDQLDEFVAAALETRPKPRERPRIKDSEILNVTKPVEIHGAITMGYGWGGGRSTRFGSLQLEYYDPVSGFSLSLGLATSSGNGYYGLYPGSYGLGPYAFAPEVWPGMSPTSRPLDFSLGAGAPFRTPWARTVSDSRRRSH